MSRTFVSVWLLFLGCYPSIKPFRDLPRPPDTTEDLMPEIETTEEGAVIPPPDTACLPNCYSKVCGPDGCGGFCGTCPEGSVCSVTQAYCVSKTIQKPLGAYCGEFGECKPMLDFSGITTYPNPYWPSCLDDQCMEGPCLFGFCSRNCTIHKDTEENVSKMPFADGIEDEDTPKNDCEGGKTQVFSTGFVCIAQKASGGNNGVCFPKSSFKPCSSALDCPPSEACGYVTLKGNIEKRCLAKPEGAVGLGKRCGYDERTGRYIFCESYLCSDKGFCSAPCDSNDQCLTEKASCKDNFCANQNKVCTTNADCSAYSCSSLGKADFFDAYLSICVPKTCLSDTQCGDEAYYCLHSTTVQSGAIQVSGECVPRLLGGRKTGEECHVGKDDETPDIPCENEAYCIQDTCLAMCENDDDCPSSMMCSLSRLGGTDSEEVFLCSPIPPSSPVCTDPSQCICSPVFRASPRQLELRCINPKPSALPFSNLCGEAFYGNMCDTGYCLLEDSANLRPGFCSKVCKDDSDCPSRTSLGSAMVKWVCAGLSMFSNFTVFLGDDLFVSWCVPVPAGSSLEKCQSDNDCEQPFEVCKPFVRHGIPATESTITGYCILSDNGFDTNMPCALKNKGEECKTGICEPMPSGDSGFCSKMCQSDLDCIDIAWDARCEKKTLVWQTDLTIGTCKRTTICSPCIDDMDCLPSFVCADATALPYMDDFRCSRACATDEDCLDIAPGSKCVETDAPYRTNETGKTKVCLPTPCS